MGARVRPTVKGLSKYDKPFYFVLLNLVFSQKGALYESI